MKAESINTFNGFRRALGRILIFSLGLFLPVYVYAGETKIDIPDTSIHCRGIVVAVSLLLVALLLVVIARLAFCLHRQRRKLRQNQEYLVRYITSNLELKKQVPTLKEPYPFNPPEITPQEFTKIIDNMLRRILFLSLFVLLVLPLAAQDNAAHAATGEMTEARIAFAPEIKNEWQLRANLLRWATLTPDLGVEWRIDRRWSILVGGTWTSWSWDNKNRRYALWEVSPEVRHYTGKQKRGYVGAMYHAGQFNYKLGDTGKQGNLMGGYLLRLNRCLSLDFNAGLGCLRADYEKYTVIDDVRVRQGKETKNWWGPIHAGVTLMWKLF